jgi:NAD+ synthase (glutamine-hydrolysing)
MKLLKIGAAALNQTPLDWKGNLDNILAAMRAARALQVQLLCLPELCITGYGCEDRFHSLDVLERAQAMLDEVVKSSTDITVCVGLPIFYDNAVYNMVALVQDGRLLGLVGKQHLAGDGLHYEPRWFKPMPAKVSSMMHFASGMTPIGDLGFVLGGDIRIGFEICEDAWVAERPGAQLARQGVDVILNPSASHFAFGKQEVRKRFVIEGSRAFSTTYVYANLLGNEAGRAIYDGECLIATGGALVAQGRRFSMKPFELTTAIVDVDATRTQTISTASFTPSYNTANWVRGAPIDLVEPGISSGAKVSELIDSGLPILKMSKLEEFSAAVPLALFDYMRKSHSQGFTISLSGGADSAACAVLARLMIANGLNELGARGFCTRAGLSDYPGEVLPRRLITCLYQGTKNSSETTLSAARTVADGLGVKFHAIDVEDLVKAYTSKMSVALQHEMSWEKDDITLQNIQARVRAPSVWMIANIENKLLLTTSNRSEAAVGYCTMDGDTAGSIAPLGGIDKAFLLEWLEYISERRCMPYLETILVQKPTAELRPGSNQTDETDLMPYSVLEFIEDRAILEKKGPRDVYLCLVSYLKDYVRDADARAMMPSTSTIYGYVEKFFRLWCRNQWKRERYALSFHVDNKNLDPRSWCRFPVLSGGFEVELAELRNELGL